MNHLHVIRVPADGEGETASDLRVIRFQIGVLQ